MSYEVKITQSGRGGTICYLENEKQLPLGWEFAMNGALIFVPSPSRWNYFCGENDLPEANDRRDEILRKVCQEIISRKASGAKYEIGDDYISISFS